MLNEQDLITKDYAKRIQKLIFENDVPLLFNDKIKQEQKEWIKLRNTEKSISA
jgi:CRISPR/Cas system-associated endoribonuclease Cas2